MHSIPRSTVPFIVFSALSAVALPGTAQVPTPTNAGQLLQQIEKERGVALPQSPPPKIAPVPQAMKPVSGATVTVTRFQFSGNVLLTDAELAAVVAEYLNRPVGFAEIQQAAAAVAELYRKRGWIVRAYLPEQDIHHGSVTIQIVEAIFGGVKLEGPPARRLALEQLQRGFEARQAKGAVINRNALDRALLLADDLPGVAVSGSLQEGGNARETDLIIKLADEAFALGEVGLDNFGARSTGSNRLTANLNLTSPLGIGDLLDGNLIHTRGTDYLRLAFTLPVGADGWRLGASASALAYRLTAAEFAALNGKGSSATAGIDAYYPLVRSRFKNLYLGVNYDIRRFDNESSFVTQSRYRSDAIALNLNGNLFDGFGGGGASSATLTLLAGRVALEKLDAGEDAALDGGFSKLRYNFSRQQALSGDVSLYLALSGQETNGKNLDSSEKFYLGGAGGVRAYPASEGGGASGSLANVELRWRLQRGFVLTGFYDHGGIRNYNGGKNYSLKGAGVMLAWQAEFGLNLKATWARRLGSNPNPTFAGNDQDGSFSKNRFWLAASQPF